MVSNAGQNLQSRALMSLCMGIDSVGMPTCITNVESIESASAPESTNER